MAYTNRFIYLECALSAAVYSGDTQPTELDGPMEFSKVEITPPVQENVEYLSNIQGYVGEAVASVPKATDPAKITLEFGSLTREFLAALLGSTVSTVTQTTGAVTDEAVTGVLDKWVRLANPYLTTATISVTKSATPVDAAKYEVDRVAGLYRALHADAVGSVLVSYTKDNATIERHAAGKAVSTKVYLYGRALEKQSSKLGTIEIWRASLAADGPFDPVVGGFFKGTLTGTLETPSGKTSPWVFDLRTA